MGGDPDESDETVKLPEMVAHTTMDDASVALLREYVNELMRCVLPLFERQSVGCLTMNLP